jgi:drug/metabolite transporter (DMT)-like permease
MRNLPLLLLFVILASCSWGICGPALHHGEVSLGAPLQPSGLRTFVCLGIAYAVVAVAVPIFLLRSRGEEGTWTVAGAAWSFAAGAAGAVGALGIVLAFKFRGSPVYVMPLLFGLAPVAYTLITLLVLRTYRDASVLFHAGIAVVALGAVGVLVFKPSPTHIVVDRLDDGSIVVSLTRVEDDVLDTTARWTAKNLEQLKTDPACAQAYKLYLRKEPLTPLQFLMIPVAIVLAAVSWGCYGPLLRKGQSSMAGSRLRPFLCVGLAYFVIAVLMPLLLMKPIAEPGGWTPAGIFWSLAGGAAGAVGALGIVLAYSVGGRPALVMPLVFGGAPAINTMTMIALEGTRREVSTPFLVSLLAVIAGAVTVLVLAPRSARPAAPPTEKDADRAVTPEVSPEPAPAAATSEEDEATSREDVEDTIREEPEMPPATSS